MTFDMLHRDGHPVFELLEIFDKTLVVSYTKISRKNK